MNNFLLVLVFAIVSAACSLPAAAQTYPVRPIRIVSGFPTGGATDIIARILGQRLTERLGQQIVVDARASAAGQLAATIVKNASGDGYTLLIVTSSHATGAAFGKLPYDAVRDFAAVSLLASGPNVLVATTGFQPRTLDELLKAARAKPGQITFGSGGNGSITHLSGELLKQMAGIDLLHVPYKGAPAGFTDLISGQIQLLFSSIPGALPHVRSGRMKAIAVTALKERSPVLSEVPTFSESGVPGYDAPNWFGLLAPTSTPQAILAKLNSEILLALKNPDVSNAFANQGVVPRGTSAPEFQAFLKQEVEKWTRVVKSAGIRPEQ